LSRSSSLVTLRQAKPSQAKPSQANTTLSVAHAVHANCYRRCLAVAPHRSKSATQLGLGNHLTVSAAALLLFLKVVITAST